METDRIICGDSLSVLETLPDGSVDCCVTSPPYFGLRDYGAGGQIGREGTPEQYVERLVAVLREVRRVLQDDGTLWLNIADTYCDKGYAKGIRPQRMKPKDMMGIPWLVAFALRADGWYLRNDVIWVKANPMPESCKDRMSRCYEHVFLLAKSKNYYYDNMAIAEPIAPGTARRATAERSGRGKYAKGAPGQGPQTINKRREAKDIDEAMVSPFRNRRDVWHINVVPYAGAHFAAFPLKLPETCILAGCPKGGTVLDPFFGSGTTGIAALSTGRHYIGIDINADYCRLAKERIDKEVSELGRA
jgi:DNA modification methylase